MKLESLLVRLEQARVEFDVKDMEELTQIMRRDAIILLLVEYIGNPKIEEKINEMVF